MKPELSVDAVKELALDLWEDLRRTRLAGVAVGLGLALLAITVIVLRPSGAPEVNSSPQYATAVATPEDKVSFTVPNRKPLKIADVDLSAPRDPFRSLDGTGSSESGAETLLPVDEAVQDAVFAPSSGGSSFTGADTAPLQPLPALSGGSYSPAPGPTEPAEAKLETAPAPKDPTPATDYSYAADIQFGRVDDLKRYSRVQRLGLVPSRRLPLLMYLGVSTDKRTAVFMIDSRLSQGGEGRCVPKASQCTFLELRANGSQDEHHFRDADGNEYLLRLRRLVRTTGETGTLAGRDVSELRGTPRLLDGTR